MRSFLRLVGPFALCSCREAAEGFVVATMAHMSHCLQRPPPLQFEAKQWKVGVWQQLNAPPADGGAQLSGFAARTQFFCIVSRDGRIMARDQGFGRILLTNGVSKCSIKVTL